MNKPPLLTDEQLNVILRKRHKQLDDLRIIAETQKNADYQWHLEQVAEIFRELEGVYEGFVEMVEHGDYKNGNTDEFGTIDEGEVMAYRRLCELKEAWQQLKSKYGGK